MKQVDVAYGNTQRRGTERWQSGANKDVSVQTLNGSRIIQRVQHGVLDETLRTKFEALAAKVTCIKACN